MKFFIIKSPTLWPRNHCRPFLLVPAHFLTNYFLFCSRRPKWPTIKQCCLIQWRIWFLPFKVLCHLLLFYGGSRSVRISCIICIEYCCPLCFNCKLVFCCNICVIVMFLGDVIQTLILIFFLLLENDLFFQIQTEILNMLKYQIVVYLIVFLS